MDIHLSGNVIQYEIELEIICMNHNDKNMPLTQSIRSILYSNTFNLNKKD